MGTSRETMRLCKMTSLDERLCRLKRNHDGENKS
jgi:hypothetical protein